MLLSGIRQILDTDYKGEQEIIVDSVYMIHDGIVQGWDMIGLDSWKMGCMMYIGKDLICVGYDVM